MSTSGAKENCPTLTVSIIAKNHLDKVKTVIAHLFPRQGLVSRVSKASHTSVMFNPLKSLMPSKKNFDFPSSSGYSDETTPSWRNVAMSALAQEHPLCQTNVTAYAGQTAHMYCCLARLDRDLSVMADQLWPRNRDKKVQS